jgi:hypothetical protein
VCSPRESFLFTTSLVATRQILAKEMLEALMRMVRAGAAAFSLLFSL